MTLCRLLDALAALGERVAGEAHDVEPVDHDRHLAQPSVVHDRCAVALVRIDRHHRDPSEPVGGVRGEPSLQDSALWPSKTSVI